MNHSICLDSEKINSKRESLEGRFNQIKIIDDSVTPKIIQWLNDFFSFLDDLKQGVFIFNKNIELERWFDYLNESKPYLYEYRDNIKELLTEEEYENYLLFVSYHKIKDDLYNENIVLKDEIINDFYLLKLPNLKPILSSIIRGIAVRLKNSNKYKKQFEDLKKNIEEFYFDSISDNTSKNETQNPIKTLVNWHPFDNDDILDFYLYLENNTTKKKKIFYSYVREFLESNNMLLLENKSTLDDYFNWINMKNDFQGKKVVEHQHNLSSSHYLQVRFAKDLLVYEKSIKVIQRI